MMRKLILAFLLFFGLNSIAQGQVRDTVTISLPPFTDTTCPGTQLIFRAAQSSDTFSHVTFAWYTNTYYTGVLIDTFYTTAVADGDSVYCYMYFTNSLGNPDTSRSNTIIVHRSTSIPANVLIGVTTGSNPDCAGHPVTFTAYPINGGTHPQFQWMINGGELTGADSITFTRVFGGADTVSCRMISNSTCAPVDTVFSLPTPIIHIHLTASISITANRGDSSCAGALDTFTAHAADYGVTAAYQWYVDTIAVPGAVNDIFVTTRLNDSDSVYCVLTTTDTCVLNPVTRSNQIIMHIIRNYNNTALARIIRGTNEGCSDSQVTLKAIVDSFGTAPAYQWFINGTLASTDDTITRFFINNDVVSLKVWKTQDICLVYDTITPPPVIMIRDTRPSPPLLSLIGDQLEVHGSGSGTYTWFYSSGFGSYTDSVIPGAVHNNYRPTRLGYYYCRRDSSNCQSLPSNIIYISLLGVNDVEMKSVTLYPNPTSGTISLDWAGQSVDITMEVYSPMGQELLHKEYEHVAHVTADLSDLPSGTYYLVLKDKHGNSSTHRITRIN